MIICNILFQGYRANNHVGSPSALYALKCDLTTIRVITMRTWYLFTIVGIRQYEDMNLFFTPVARRFPQLFRFHH